MAQLNFIIQEEDKDPVQIPGPQIARNGIAAEHLVCADLLSRGLDAYIVHNRPYDIIIDNGNLLKLQVKSTGKQRPDPKGNLRYFFGGAQTTAARRGQSRLAGLKNYAGKIDAFAFVALDIKRIIYLPINSVVSTAISFSTNDFIVKEDPSFNLLKSLV